MAAGLSGANTVLTSNGTRIAPEWSHGPLTNSLLPFLPLKLPLLLDAADVGEPGVLPVSSAAENSPGSARSGMCSCGSSVCTMRARGTGPGPEVEDEMGAGPQKAGHGSEGSVCRGWPRVGSGPLWSRSGVGGERRTMLLIERCVVDGCV